MSNTPVDHLLDAVGDMDVLAEAVETHLDEHPLPVDERVVQQVSERLMARIERAQPAPSRWRWVWGGLALAAVISLSIVVSTGRLDTDEAMRETERASDATKLQSVERAPDEVRVVRFEGVERSVVVPPGADLILREDDRSAVMLVRRGDVQVDDGSTVPQGHWTLLRRLPDGASVTVTFPDGQAPPPLHEDVWGPTEVQVQLESARFEALPQRTLEALEAIQATAD